MEKATLMSEEEISPELYRELMREVAQDAKKRAEGADKELKKRIQTELSEMIERGYGR